MSTPCCECGTFLYSQRDPGYPAYELSLVVGTHITSMSKVFCRSCLKKVEKSEEELLENCLNTTCDKCGLVKTLSTMHKQAIGLSRYSCEVKEV